MSANNNTTTIREQTFLRVKRRRSENPPSTIRLELLGGWNVHRQDENEDANITDNNGHHYPLRSSSTATLADSRHSAMSSTSTQTASNVMRGRTTAAAVWKRVEDLPGQEIVTAAQKRCRVVEAIFESEGGPSTKRRKLTVLGEAQDTATNTANATANNKKKKHNIYKVLDPTSRLVDDSLNMVHAGDKSIAQHYQLVTTDPRLATNARKWLVYSTHRGGNLLHACAHWNDVECARDLLRQSLPGLADATDGDGRTPYEIAQLCPHDNMVQVLEAFGADTTNFVYDMFVPEEIQVETMPVEEETKWNPLEKTAIANGNHTKMATTTTTTSDNPAQQQQQQQLPMDASRLLELQGGVGYWTENGDLILEVEAHHMMGIHNEFGQHESDLEDEDDIDSNCEDYGGNDYPDEEEEDHYEWEDDFLHQEPQIEDDPYDTMAPTAEEYDMW